MGDVAQEALLTVDEFVKAARHPVDRPAEVAEFVAATGGEIHLEVTIGDPPGDLTITGPDGTETVLAMPQTAPGRQVAEWQAPDLGLYRLAQGDLSAVIAVGPQAPKEFEQTIATGVVLAPVVAALRGGTLALADGLPDLRTVAGGRVAAGGVSAASR
jgi:hypothetical protein